MHIANISTKSKIFIILLFIIITLITIGIFVLINKDDTSVKDFSGERAFDDVVYQTRLGPRTIGSDAHVKIVSWITDNLSANGWEVVHQKGSSSGIPINNIIAKRGTGKYWIILGAHYDSRSVADKDSDPEKRLLPVSGANDGASGVAILLELARILPDNEDITLWLVFFDAEDNGSYQGQEWIMGSRLFVDELNGEPDAVVIIDMVGDIDLNLYWERNSDPELNIQLWDTANKLGYNDIFVPKYKYSIIDDHIPFLEAGISAVDIIDFDYPYWHTSEDTDDKVSPDSLYVVGNTLLKWLETYKPR